MGQGYERVWSSSREKGEPILGFPLKLLWGEMSYWMTFHSKEVNIS